MLTEFFQPWRLALVVLMAAPVAGPGTALAQTTQSVTPSPGKPDPDSYWTPERMRAARPLPMPALPGQPVPAPGPARPRPAGLPQGATAGKPTIQTNSPSGQSQGGEPSEQ